ncbi:ATP-grasp domain-containing protein [Natronocalculus amylovorans]|uniref:ATP-grasp domain-containing protein n=1 Tax=Natronocalculus amylovorans TaxID=2917812 RepID=A0AAE3FZQ0_9EURY|nr:ATP-grasp domain-containing protein [Natronocalculus amylovorans]MCL9818304.1 ATP-grasp domain-containing protein [Natronocalculus amylovorans]
METNKILITDGRTLSCLAFVRKLGREGMDVHVGESFKRNITAYSKFTSESHVYPSAEDDMDGFKTYILKLIQQEQYDFVLPTRDTTTIALAEIQDQLPTDTNMLVDTPEKIQRLNDKHRCAKLAEQVGVPIPTTYYPSETPIEEISSKADFPVLVKPTDASGSRGIQRVETPQELRPTYHSVLHEHGNAIVQEFVDHSGGHFSIGTVFDRKSKPQAVHVYKELLQYPDSGGPAIQAVSSDPEPWVEEMLAILEAINWIGPAHMDVLFDPVDDTYKLLEVNPRIWMSVALSIKSGVDIPNVILNLATGTDTTDPQSYRTDLHYRWVLPNEILWILNGGDRVDRIKKIAFDRKIPVCYGVLSREDPFTIIGTLAQSADFLLDTEKRQLIFDRGW